VLHATNFLKPVNVSCDKVSWDIKNYFKGHIHGKKGLETLLESFKFLLTHDCYTQPVVKAMTSLFVQQMNCDTQ
jgi:hypothetical protein